MIENIRDIAKFGYREREIAARLLSALQTDKDETRFLKSEGITLEFNPNSGNVFLIDDNFNVAMMNGEYLEDWFNCPECGNEGFLEDMERYDNECCEESLEEINK